MRPARGTLGRRLAFTFALIAAFTMVLAALILAYVWAGQFGAYVEENLQQTADGAAAMLSATYERVGGWSYAAFQQLPRFGMLSGLALQVLDVDGNIIYDDSTAQTFAEHMMMGPPQGASEPKGTVVTAPVVAESEVVGVVRVWSLSPQGLFSENDVRFRTSSFLGLLADRKSVV